MSSPTGSGRGRGWLATLVTTHRESEEPARLGIDRADADWFLGEILVIYPILGIDAFEIAASEPAPPGGADELVLDQRGGHGRGRETKEGFVVLAGS